jgi:hypothetical protein
VKRIPEQGEWFLSFNTPWLLTPQEAKDFRQRASTPRGQRD